MIAKHAQKSFYCRLLHLEKGKKHLRMALAQPSIPRPHRPACSVVTSLLVIVFNISRPETACLGVIPVRAGGVQRCVFLGLGVRE
jgi:hypothetical protein